MPATGGWHWLRRRDNAAWRLGFWDRMRSTWLVADAIGRTSGKSPFNVARLLTYHGPVEPAVVPKQWATSTASAFIQPATTNMIRPPDHTVSAEFKVSGPNLDEGAGTPPWPR